MAVKTCIKTQRCSKRQNLCRSVVDFDSVQAASFFFMIDLHRFSSSNRRSQMWLKIKSALNRTILSGTRDSKRSVLCEHD